MIIAIALAGLAVVIAVVVLASGMGGELAETHPDHPPLPLPGNRPIAGTDAALLRLPMGIWGYHARVTDEALRRLSYALTERDTRIAILEQQTAELRHKLESLESSGAGAGQETSGWRAAPAAPADPAQDRPWIPPVEALEMESHPRPDPDPKAATEAHAPQAAQAHVQAAESRAAQPAESRTPAPAESPASAERRERAAEDGTE
ncbi:MAG TPA: hypothetical protein VH912_17415 [Streptosporangiaceae bacterium]